MSLFRTLSRPRSHTAGSKTIANAFTTADISPTARRYRYGHKADITETERRRFGCTKKEDVAGGIEDVFIRSLVAAGRCSEHRRLQWHGERRYAGQRCVAIEQKRSVQHTSKRDFSTSAGRTQTAVAFAQEDEPGPLITRDEYKDIVNTYGLPSDMWDEPLPAALQSKKRKKEQEEKALNPYRLAPRLVIPPDKEDQPPHSARVVLPPEDKEHAYHKARFKNLLWRKVGTFNQDRMWAAYEKLRKPRVRYLIDADVRRLFHQLSWNEYAHTPHASQRYFAVLDECMREEVPLTTVEWSTAIHFAGRQMRHGTSEDVKDAIELWMKMEESGVEANNVTFNILFYTAVKAGRFALADTIYNELQARGMELDRYFHASKIYYAGLRGNGDGVRRAFNDLVNASEIVDVGIMNCVILSLIRAGEPAAAEHIFGKMKILHETKFGTKAPEHWQEQRRLFKLLGRTGKALRQQQKEHISSFFGTAFSGDDRKEQIQRATPIAPNAKTYRLLLRYHARVSGSMESVQELLDESKACGFHTHGSVYLNIFYGFHRHGGFPFTAWSPAALNGFWEEFLAASSPTTPDGMLAAGAERVSTPRTAYKPIEVNDSHLDAFASTDSLVKDFDDLEQEEDLADDAYLSEEHRPPYFTQSMAIVALRAYYKCCGRNRMLEVWAEIKDRWKECGPVERETIDGMIEEMLRWDI